MAWMDPLTANLLDLLFELREHPVPLTIGGGFGLYLKRMRLNETHERTLFSRLPMPRATNDLDLFVRADVLCDLESMNAVAAALDRLGYDVRARGETHAVEEAHRLARPGPRDQGRSAGRPVGAIS